jgi:hypothetical protein
MNQALYANMNNKTKIKKKKKENTHLKKKKRIPPITNVPTADGNVS